MTAALLGRGAAPLRALLSSTFVRFALVSATGLGGDFTLFACLTTLGIAPLLANIASAGAGVTFVYFASVCRIFRYRGQFLYAKFLAYLAYQAVAIFLASDVIAVLAAHAALPPFVAKLAVTPFTFCANFLFMRWLTRAPR